MPSHTPAQASYMRARAHGWHKPGGGDAPIAVAKEFMAADEAKKKGSRSKMQRADRKRHVDEWASGQTRSVLAKPET